MGLNDLGLLIKVITLNCWGIPYVSQNKYERMLAITSYLALGKYDIVSLQEIWDKNDFQEIALKVESVLPYSHYFHSGVIGSGVCVFSKWPIEDVFFHQFSLNGYAHMVHHADWFGGKGIGLCKIRGNDNLSINFYSAHLHAEYCSNDIYLAHRVIQAYDTAEFIKLTSSSADVVILAGDLNTKPTDLAFQMIHTIANLEDSFMYMKQKENCSEKGTSEGNWNSYTDPAEAAKCPQGKRIDYILYNSRQNLEMKTVNYELPISHHVPGFSFSYSDHDAVAAKFVVKNKSGDFNCNTNITECLSVMKVGVVICKDALIAISRSRYKYFASAMVMIFILTLLLPYIDAENMALLALLKIITLLLFLYCMFMATLWNNMERNGVLAAYVGMKRFMEFHSKDEVEVETPL